MANCPECGKPMTKDKSKAKYYCENSACSVIFVNHPEIRELMRVAYKARAR